MIHGVETWADDTDTWTVKKAHEKKLDMVEDGCVVTKPDKIRKELIRGKARCRKVVWANMEKRNVFWVMALLKVRSSLQTAIDVKIF